MLNQQKADFVARLPMNQQPQAFNDYYAGEQDPRI